MDPVGFDPTISGFLSVHKGKFFNLYAHMSYKTSALTRLSNGSEVIIFEVIFK